VGESSVNPVLGREERAVPAHLPLVRGSGEAAALSYPRRVITTKTTRSINTRSCRRGNALCASVIVPSGEELTWRRIAVAEPSTDGQYDQLAGYSGHHPGHPVHGSERIVEEAGV